MSCSSRARASARVVARAAAASQRLRMPLVAFVSAIWAHAMSTLGAPGAYLVLAVASLVTGMVR